MKRKFDLNTIMEEEEIQFGSVYNNGVSWLRGSLLGKGGFGSVFIAKLKKLDLNTMYRPIMAVKSAEVCESSSLQKEKEIYDDLYDSPYILQCLGEETTTDQYGRKFYNVLLEYASSGTLASLIKKSGSGGLPESDVKRYTRFILKGIHYIHSHGYVHCDLKPENILLVSNDGSVDGKFVPKIGDFGLAKKIVKNRKFGDSYTGGTIAYMAPETAADQIQETPCDIWGLGCIVFEMLTGNRVWDSHADSYGFPEIPSQVSKDAKDFLKSCLVKNPAFRFTAEMLLDHQFLSGLGDDYERQGSEDEVLKNSVETLYDSGCSHEIYESEDEMSKNSVEEYIACSIVRGFFNKARAKLNSKPQILTKKAINEVESLYDSDCSELCFSSCIDDHVTHESEDEESTNSVVRLCDSDKLGNYTNVDLLLASYYGSCVTGIAS
ncbi:mitogen-activated protein kinase kinase kinase 20-like [Mercurialis annua]|uniref:mitogen-activated protein kinase kinase kinase 20-like n=1 Tax=Mercurialis annua TaxID=3986 RepID=UPI0021607D73|nr:mitogen-activated protein kinase kinase kinase 20-like [Mercurialis annua]